MPANGGRDAPIVSILRDHIDGRIPRMAAGHIKTPAQAARPLDLGLSLVAVGQGLVTDLDWMAHARLGHDADIQLSISAADVLRVSIQRPYVSA